MNWVDPSALGGGPFESAWARNASQTEHSWMMSVTAKHKIEPGSRPAADRILGTPYARVVAPKAPARIIPGGQRVMQNDGAHPP